MLTAPQLLRSSPGGFLKQSIKTIEISDLKIIHIDTFQSLCPVQILSVTAELIHM